MCHSRSRSARQSFLFEDKPGEVTLGMRQAFLLLNQNLVTNQAAHPAWFGLDLSGPRKARRWNLYLDISPQKHRSVTNPKTSQTPHTLLFEIPAILYMVYTLSLIHI